MLALPLFAAATLVGAQAPHPSPLPLATPAMAVPVEAAEPAEVPLEAPAPLPLPAPTVRETAATVPADIAVDVRKAGGDGWTVKLARRGYLVAMRHGDVRSAGADQATLALQPGDGEPLVWEATHLDTLATTRGTLRLDAAADGAPTPQARVRLAEAPVPAGRDERQLHTCLAHEDGAGGFSVLCRVRANPTAANLSGDDAKANVWVATAAGRSPVVRLDLPASTAGVDARMVGYAAGIDGVVIRAEASRVAGEDRPVLALASADHSQPQVPRQIVRYTCCLFRDP